VKAAGLEILEKVNHGQDRLTGPQVAEAGSPARITDYAIKCTFNFGDVGMRTLERLASALGSGQQGAILHDFDFSTEKQNQMLFFIKPEIFLLKDKETVLSTCSFIFDKFNEFAVDVAGAYLVPASTLEAHQIMDRHYGYINQMSRGASRLLSEPDRSAIARMLETDGSVPIFGGHEILASNPQLDASRLDTMWATKKSLKLRSGLYVQKFEINGAPTIIVNGFHPSQIMHFIDKGRKILLVLLNSDLPWKFLRSRMLGDTFPERAAAGSIRGELYRNPAKFGFESVTIANNCAHLSAGPFEAVFELTNFLSALPDVPFSLSSSRLGEFFLDANMSPVELQKATSNPTSALGGGTPTSLFEATEESDAASSVALYKKWFAGT
jgi:hypothetical protein